MLAIPTLSPAGKPLHTAAFVVIIVPLLRPPPVDGQMGLTIMLVVWFSRRPIFKVPGRSITPGPLITHPLSTNPAAATSGDFVGDEIVVRVLVRYRGQIPAREERPLTSRPRITPVPMTREILVAAGRVIIELPSRWAN